METEPTLPSSSGSNLVITEPKVLASCSGVWRYIGEDRNPYTCNVTHGEGCTPLVEVPAKSPGFQTSWLLKLESRNPTGSIEDRGVAVAVSAVKSRGAKNWAVLASPWRAVSLAAYGARAGLRLSLEFTERPTEMVVQECVAYGAQIGRAGRKGTHDLHSAESPELMIAPHLALGLGTLAYEVVEQLGQLPSLVVVPVIDDLLVRVMKQAFGELVAHDEALSMPKIMGVDFLGKGHADALRVEHEEAVQWALRLAREQGIATSLAGGAGAAVLARLHASGELRPHAPVVVIDPLAPKFFEELYQFKREANREENKLGGLITPR